MASQALTGTDVTPVQQELVLSAAAGPAGRDHIHVRIAWRRALDRSAVSTAWAEVIARHPVLASQFVISGTRICAEPAPDAAAVAWTEVPDSAYEIAVARAIAQVRGTRLGRLGAGAALTAVAAPHAGTTLLMSFHHAVADGRSLRVVVDDFARAYAVSADGVRVRENLPPRAGFTDYARWWQARAEAGGAAVDPAYWRRHLEGPPAATGLVDPSRGDAQLHPATTPARLPADLDAALAGAARDLGVSVGTLVHAAWALVLSRRTGGEVAAFVTTIAARHGSVPDADRVVGPMINTLPVRLALDPSERVDAFVTRVRATLLAHRDHGGLPLNTILAGTGNGELTAAIESLVMVERETLEEWLHDRHPAWRTASIEVLRHIGFPVGVYVFTRHPTRLDLLYDEATLTRRDAEALLDELVGVLRLLATHPASPVGVLLGRARGAGRAPRRDRSTLRFPAGALDDTRPVTRVPGAASAPTRARPDGTGDPGTQDGHRVALTEEWGLWRDFVLRTAGMDFAVLDALADPAYTALVDAHLADPDAPAPTPDDFAAAAGRLSAALYDIAAHPFVREAVAWQNRVVLHSGFAPLMRRGPEAVRRNTKHRQHEAMVANYVHRYAAKNDTIGFFGPVGWARLTRGDDVALTVGERALSRRTAFLEGWAVTAYLDPWLEALRPHLPPRLVPTIIPGPDSVRLPLGERVPLTALQAAVLAACDGRRTPARIAAHVAARRSIENGELQGPPAGLEDVCAILADFADKGWIGWGVEIPLTESRPEAYARDLLESTPPSAARDEALGALSRLWGARDALARAAGDAGLVEQAMSDLEALFHAVTGAQPRRRSGALYAGRTLAYEECRLGTDLELGIAQLDGARAGLTAILDGSRWFAAAAVSVLESLLDELLTTIQRRDGVGPVPMVDVWMLIVDEFFDASTDLKNPVVAELESLWARVLELPEDNGGEIRLDGAEVAARAHTVFATADEVPPHAVQHSPDLMLIPGAGPEPPAWVLGEVHPGRNTVEYRTWVGLHDDPSTLRAAMTDDMGGPVVWFRPSGVAAGAPTRLTNALGAPRDSYLECAADAFGPAAERGIRVADLDLDRVDGRLRVTHRPTGAAFTPAELLGDALGATMLQHFGVVPARPGHSPRVWIDRLCVARETWRCTAGDLAFATITDEAARFLEVRRWARSHGLPRHIFLKTAGEKKPVYIDLTSLVSIDILARAVRRASRDVGPDAAVTITEMLPGPDDLWFTGPGGGRHTAELRMVATWTGGRAS